MRTLHQMCLAWLVFAGRCPALPAAAGECGSLGSLEGLLGEWRRRRQPSSTLRESWAVRSGRRPGKGLGDRGVHGGPRAGRVRRGSAPRGDGQAACSPTARGGDAQRTCRSPFRLSRMQRRVDLVFANAAHDFPTPAGRTRRPERSGPPDAFASATAADKGFTLDFRADQPVPVRPTSAAVLCGRGRPLRGDGRPRTRRPRAAWFAEDLVVRAFDRGRIVRPRTADRATIPEPASCVMAASAPSAAAMSRLVRAPTPPSCAAWRVSRCPGRGRSRVEFSRRGTSPMYALQAGDWRLRAWQVSTLAVIRVARYPISLVQWRIRK